MMKIFFLMAFIQSFHFAKIEDSFVYCDLKNLNKIVNDNLDCQNQSLSLKPDVSFVYKEVVILSKNDFVINDFGYQCFKKKIIREMKESYFFEKTENIKREIIDLSPFDCMSMIRTRKCIDKDMICDQDNCIYTSIPPGNFTWGQTRYYENFECVFQKRLIVGINSKQALFSFNRTTCRVHDQFCLLIDSTIVWEKEQIIDAPYVIIHQGEHYQGIQNFVLSFDDQLLFQLEKLEKYLKTYIWSTVEGLYIYIINNNETDRSILNFPHATTDKKKRLLKQRDIADLNLAERDFNTFALRNNIFEEDRASILRNCLLFNNQLKILAALDDTLHKIQDYNGNKLIIYSKFNRLFIPDCSHIDRIEIIQTDECYFDLPVSIINKEKKINVFLANNNFLKGYSNKIDCELVNERIILPSNKKVIVRSGKNWQVHEIHDLNFLNIMREKKNYTHMNFFHLGQIVQGYESLNIFEKIEDLNDIFKGYLSIPDDRVKKTSDFVNGLVEVKKRFSNSIQQIELIIYYIGLLCVFVLIVVVILIIFKINEKFFKRY